MLCSPPPWQRSSQCLFSKGSLPQSTSAFLDLFLAASFPLTLLPPFPSLCLFSTQSLSWGRTHGGNLPNFPSDGWDILLSPLSSAPRRVVCSAAFPLPCDIFCRSLVGGRVGNGSTQPTWLIPLVHPLRLVVHPRLLWAQQAALVSSFSFSGKRLQILLFPSFLSSSYSSKSSAWTYCFWEREL